MRPEAEREIMDAAFWYDGQRSGLGDEFLDAVRAAGQRALEAPGMYQCVHRDMRRVLIPRFPYMLIFQERSDEVIVLGCVHGHRDPRLWQSRG